MKPLLNLAMREAHADNIGLAIWRAKCFYKTFVLKQTLGVLMNFSAENTPHHQL